MIGTDLRYFEIIVMIPFLWTILSFINVCERCSMFLIYCGFTSYQSTTVPCLESNALYLENSSDYIVRSISLWYLSVELICAYFCYFGSYESDMITLLIEWGTLFCWIYFCYLDKYHDANFVLIYNTIQSNNINNENWH